MNMQIATASRHESTLELAEHVAVVIHGFGVAPAASAEPLCEVGSVRVTP